MFKIYYIHGFNSSPESETLMKLRETFPTAIGLTYDYEDPLGSVSRMSDNIHLDTYPIIVGSSLGGWYAEKLSQTIVGDYIFYNPSTCPNITLNAYGVPRLVLDKYIDTTIPKNGISRSVFLSTDDLVIDHSIALNKYSSKAYIKTTTGGHRMTPTNMKLITDRIKFLQNQLTI